ncbi:MAG: diguanylate cyclase [Rhodobacteraceae bacterium]|nr:diguanylate cyclase [Paracoccaceae bacterium]MDA7551366.1 ABC transporter substrate-binding protein [Paracoccaceae bacterium]
MIYRTRTGKPLGGDLLNSASSAKDNPMNRREFLATATSFGATAATAYALLGISAAAASTEQHKMGGTVRIQQSVPAPKDPRLLATNQLANFVRGWLEHLVVYENDGTFSPKLLESWSISEDSKTYMLNVRKGVTWNNGDPFTAHDVVRNIKRWCDTATEGNSMATRFATLVDADTGQAIEGAVEAVDDHTVRLNLPKADITLIAGMSDYPACIVHDSFSPDTMLDNPIGTGPYLPESYVALERAVLTKNADHSWWNEGNGAWMDRIEFLDYGQEPVSWQAAAEADEVDMLHFISGDYVGLVGALDGWAQHDVVSASTFVVRPNQLAEVNGKKPYANKRVRRALQMAIDNSVLLELGVAGHGQVAENHHVAPAHPEYAPLPKQKYDPEGALALLKEAGMEGFEHEVSSLDAGEMKDIADATAGQLRKAGLKVKRTVYPASTFWNGWSTYPFSVSPWNHRPLGVQVWALAYRSGAPWNEFGWANEEFDAILETAVATADVDKRRELVAAGAKLVQDEGVTVQPFWTRLFNHTRENLVGGGIQLSFDIHPDRLAWT